MSTTRTIGKSLLDAQRVLASFILRACHSIQKSGRDTLLGFDQLLTDLYHHLDPEIIKSCSVSLFAIGWIDHALGEKKLPQELADNLGVVLESFSIVLPHPRLASFHTSSCTYLYLPILTILVSNLPLYPKISHRNSYRATSRGPSKG